MDENLIIDFLNLRERALCFLRKFLSKNQRVIVIQESKMGETPSIASNTIIHRNRIYADYIEPEWEIRVNDLSFDEIYHILRFLEEVNDG